MGISFAAIEKMESLGLFEQRACRVLDIGSSNVYDAFKDSVVSFVRRHNPEPRPDLEEWAAQIEIDSKFDPMHGGTNKAFVGEVLEAAGMLYESIDLTPGYRTNILDLNRQRLPEDFVGGFDVALNFGTTEHIFNQINCFSAIHHAVVRGGFMFHQLPNVGHVNHGYYCYTGRFFFDLAGFNKYDVVDCWFDRAQMTENLFEPIRAYERTFPALTKVLSRLSSDETYRSIARIAVPVVGINMAFRKMLDAPFVGAMEFSTTVGDVAADIKNQYVQSDLNEAPVGQIS